MPDALTLCSAKLSILLLSCLTTFLLIGTLNMSQEARVRSTCLLLFLLRRNTRKRLLVVSLLCSAKKKYEHTSKDTKIFDFKRSLCIDFWKTSKGKELLSFLLYTLVFERTRDTCILSKTNV